MSIFFDYNSSYYKEGVPIITPDGRSLKYGDGLFETIKMFEGKILLKEYHFQRLFTGMKVLAFQPAPYFTADFLEDKITVLAKKNRHLGTTKARLMIFRGNGSIIEPDNHLPNYIIQTWDLPSRKSLNDRGLIIDVYHDVKKSCDILANIKTNNFLPYALAAMHAKNSDLDDCVLLNAFCRICDTSVTNIFIIKDQQICTPPLSEGCIAGVMRRWILQHCKSKGIAAVERPLYIEDVKEADEVFLSNSIHTILWVQQFKNIRYGNTQIQALYNGLVKTF